MSRTWGRAPIISAKALGALLAAGSLVIGGGLALGSWANDGARAADGYDASSLQATAQRFVDAVNSADWVGVSLAASQECRSEAYARALAEADGLLRDVTSTLVSTDEATGTTVTRTSYPATGQRDVEATFVWRYLEGRWTAPIDGCDPDTAPMPNYLPRVPGASSTGWSIAQ